MNPFDEILPYVMFNDRKYDLLFKASIAWDTATDHGNKANDDVLYSLLFSLGLTDIFVKYEFYRNGNLFDMDALQKAVEDWAYE